jgi:hypothetical protein
VKAGSVLQDATSSGTHQQGPGILTPRTITSGHHCNREGYPFFFDDFGFKSAEHGV